MPHQLYIVSIVASQESREQSWRTRRVVQLAVRARSSEIDTVGGSCVWWIGFIRWAECLFWEAVSRVL
jgi:hypothetical protein